MNVKRIMADAAYHRESNALTLKDPITVDLVLVVGLVMVNSVFHQMKIHAVTKISAIHKLNANIFPIQPYVFVQTT